MEEDLNGKLQSLKSICLVNSYEKTFSSWDLLNNLKTLNLETLFFNLNVIFRIFSMTPVTVACAHNVTSQHEKNRECFTYDRVSRQIIKPKSVADDDRICEKYQFG